MMCSMGYQRYDCSETTLLLVSWSCIQTFLVLLNAVRKHLIHSFRSTSLMTFYHCILFAILMCVLSISPFSFLPIFYTRFHLFVYPICFLFSAHKHSQKDWIWQSKTTQNFPSKRESEVVSSREREKNMNPWWW